MKNYLLFILISILAICVVFYVAGIREEQWIDVQQPNHPPVVEITRMNESVKIKYYGGWTQSFIDHLMVKSSAFPQRLYQAKPGGVITYPLCPENTTFEVYAFDKATQYYQKIGSGQL
jgi:hypothetical protein